MDRTPTTRRVTKHYCRCGKEHSTLPLAYACPCYTAGYADKAEATTPGQIVAMQQLCNAVSLALKGCHPSASVTLRIEDGAAWVTVDAQGTGDDVLVSDEVGTPLGVLMLKAAEVAAKMKGGA